MAARGYEFYFQLEKIKFRIPERRCNILFIIQILIECPYLKQLVLLIFEMIKKWSPTAKTRMLCNMKRDMKVMKNKS